MVRRIIPIGRPRKAETEVRRHDSDTPARHRPAGPDPGEVAFPAIDVYETRGELVVEMELPGVTAQDVSILLYPKRLEVKGLKREAPVGKEFSYLRLEREFGRFRRELVVPCAVDPDKAFASLENGILSIVLKKPLKRAREGRSGSGTGEGK